MQTPTYDQIGSYFTKLRTKHIGEEPCELPSSLNFLSLNSAEHLKSALEQTKRDNRNRPVFKTKVTFGKRPIVSEFRPATNL